MFSLKDAVEVVVAAAVEMAAAVDAHVVDVADKSLFRTLGIECSGIEMMRYKNCFCKNLYIKQIVDRSW